MWEFSLISMMDYREQIAFELVRGRGEWPSIIISEQSFIGGRPCFDIMSIICHLCGVALLSGHPATIIGKAPLVELALDITSDVVKAPKADRPFVMQTLRTMILNQLPARHAQAWLSYVDAAKLRHKVVEHNVGFRIWPGQDGYDRNSPHEVQLRANAGGQRLGGIIFPFVQNNACN